MVDFIHSLIVAGKPLQQNQSIAVCSKAGINLLSRDKVKLEALRESLELTIRELSSAKTRTEYTSAALLGLRLVKANCDAFISLAADATKLVSTFIPNPATKALAKGAGAVSSGYSSAQSYVEVKTAAESGQIDVKGVNSLSKGATKNIKGADLLHAKVDILHDAMKGDYQALKKDIGNYAYDVHKKAAELTVLSGRKGGYLSAGGARTLAKSFEAIDATKSVVTAAFDYSNSLEKAFDERIADEDYMRDIGQQIKTATTKLKNVQVNLAQVNKSLRACFASMEAGQFTNSSNMSRRMP